MVQIYVPVLHILFLYQRARGQIKTLHHKLCLQGSEKLVHHHLRKIALSVARIFGDICEGSNEMVEILLVYSFSLFLFNDFYQ
jgi:hypothetical protein